MKLTKTLLLFVALAASLKSGAQSQYQFTQFNMNPLYMNPAQTGAYEGTYRVGGIYRSQWNVGAADYKPLTAYVDAPILLIAKRHWVGIGLMYAKDEAGTHNLGTRLTALSGAFHYALDKRYKNVLTLGVQAGVGSAGLNSSNKDNAFYTQIANTKGVGNPWDLLSDKNTSYTDLNAGLLFKSTIDKASKISVGLSFAHVNNPKKSLLKTPSGARLPLYLAGIISYDRKINNKLSIHPTILLHKQTKANTINPQVMVGYKMSQKGDPITIKGGLGYDINGNAGNLLAGVEYKDIVVGVGYDLNTGALQNARQNALEIAIQYTGKIYKKPSVKPVIVCPKY
jgi:type IX secretion system PorP/SprF family membrane protein